MSSKTILIIHIFHSNFSSQIEMKLRLFLVVLAVSLVLLPIYFFNLPSELVPRSSQQVINYFYDTRTYIGIQRMVASSNNDNIGKGIHRNLKGEEDLYRDDDGERKEKETRSSSLSSPSPTSPSQKPHSLTDEQEKSLAQDTPKPLVTPPLQKASAQRVKLPPRLTSIPQYLMSQVQSHLSGLGLNPYSKMLQEKRKRPHGAAWKAMQKLSKRSYEAARKERVKALMRMRLRQRIEMQQLPVTVNCTDKACEQLKDLRERYYYEACLKEAQTEHEVKPCQCTLLDGKKRGRYALLSLPGSGNTWVRGLLEKATGVCTGSMWCDPSLRAKHFCMEGVRSTSVLVVKNHDTHLRWVGVPLGDGESVNNKPDFIGGILIHRNPFRATIAEWNRDAAVILTANITDEAEDSTQATQTIFNYNQPTSSEAVFKDVLSSETRKAVHRLHRNVTSDSLGVTKNHHLSYFGKEMFGK